MGRCYRSTAERLGGNICIMHTGVVMLRAKFSFQIQILLTLSCRFPVLITVIQGRISATSEGNPVLYRRAQRAENFSEPTGILWNLL